MVLLFTVLKIVGIVVLVLVALAFILLFWPISYEIQGNTTKRRATVKVNWLLHLVRFRLEYKGKLSAVLYLAFVKLDLIAMKNKPKNPKKAKRKRKRQQKKLARKAKKREKKRAKAAAKRASERTKNQSVNTKEAKMDYIIDDEPVIREKTPGILSKISGIWDKLKAAWNIIQAMDQTGFLSRVWPPVQKFLVHLRPKKLEGFLEFGLGDPALTGKVLGALVMLPLWYQYEFMIYPDFEAEEFYLRGEIDTKGNIQLIFVVILILRLVRDKQIRRFIKLIRKK